jgi:rRNA-processing protein FCF1
MPWSTGIMISEKKEHNSPMVIFDASILISLLECKVNLEDEIERILSSGFNPVVLSGTLSEIKEVLRRSKGNKRRKQLTLALQIAEKFNKLDYEPLDKEEMDDVIFRAAKALRAVVATNDHGLRKKLVGAGMPVLFIREKSHIEVDGYLSDLGANPIHHQNLIN